MKKLTTLVLALVTHMADQLLGARAGRLRAKLHIK